MLNDKLKRLSHPCFEGATPLNKKILTLLFGSQDSALCSDDELHRLLLLLLLISLVSLHLLLDLKPLDDPKQLSMLLLQSSYLLKIALPIFLECMLLHFDLFKLFLCPLPF